MDNIAKMYPDWVALSAKEEGFLLNSGIEESRVIKVRDTDRLLEGESVISGDTLRGWYRDGEGIPGINWKWENVDGWPESVQA